MFNRQANAVINNCHFTLVRMENLEIWMMPSSGQSGVVETARVTEGVPVSAVTLERRLVIRHQVGHIETL